MSSCEWIHSLETTDRDDIDLYICRSVLSRDQPPSMYPIQHGGVESPIASDRNQPATPIFDRRLNVAFSQGNAKKWPRSYTSPPAREFTEANHSITQKTQMTSSNETSTKIVFPPFVFKFIGEQKETIKELTDELSVGWKQQHGIDLCVTARFDHMQSVLIVTNEVAFSETLLNTSRWPRSLSGVEVNVKEQRQLTQKHSLVIQQLHRNWDEDDWLVEKQARYPTLSKINRIRIKDGSPLNAVRTDSKSVAEVRQIIELGKICVGSMIHAVKRYYLPVRINKCQKWLQHDHTTKSGSRPRLCSRCATEHTMGFACSDDVRCANCGGEHFWGSSACPSSKRKDEHYWKTRKNKEQNSWSSPSDSNAKTTRTRHVKEFCNLSTPPNSSQCSLKEDHTRNQPRNHPHRHSSKT